jgi:hypothetical protein
MTEQRKKEPPAGRRVLREVGGLLSYASSL